MRRGLATALLLLIAAAAAFAQFGFARGPFREYPNIPYDGRFTFVRLKYTTAPGCAPLPRTVVSRSGADKSEVGSLKLEV